MIGLMSTIEPGQFGQNSSPQSPIEDAYTGGLSGGGQTPGQSQGTTRSPQQLALDTFDSYTQSAQQYVNRELSIGVPSNLLGAHEMTATLVSSIAANSTQALAAAAQKLSPQAALALLAP